MVNKTMFRELFFKPLWAKKKYLFFIFFGLVMMTLGQSLLLLILGPLVKSLFSLGLNQDLIKMADLFEQKFFTLPASIAELSIPRKDLVTFIPLTLIGLGIVKSIGTYWYQLGAAAVNLVLAQTYRNQLFHSILSKSYLELSKHSPGQWMSFLMSDVLFLQTRFSDILNSTLRDGLSVVASFIALLVIKPELAFFLILCCPLIAMGMGRTGRRIAQFASQAQARQGLFAKAALDIRKRFDFIRSQCGEDRELEQFTAVNKSYYLLMRKSFSIRASFAPLMELFGFGLFALIIVLINHHFIQQGTSEHLIIFFAAVGSLLRPLRNIGEQFVRFNETRGALLESLSHIHIETEKPNPYAQKKIPLTTQVTISQFACGYNETPAFVSHEPLIFERGKSYAIIGPSGSGKSSFLKCLAGLIDPKLWEASVDHQHFFASSAFVSQRPFFFADLIKTNLCYGQQSTIADDEIFQALALAQIENEIKALPQGLDTAYGGLIKTLSGGQLQRLVIARSLLREKTIMLFDEATSALDVKTERLLTASLLRWAKEKEKILISVTHRLSVLNNYDWVLFLEEGKLLFQGPHTQLLQHKRYREFYEAAV